MDEKLQRLARKLREETCPQRVLDEVARRLSTQARPPNRLRYRIAGVVAVLVLLCGITVWRWPAGGDAPERSKRAGRVSADSTRVAEEAEGALGCIGAILRDAGARSERVILKGAVPPLRNGLETAKNKILDHI
jgi:hypothetical protein